MAHRIREWGVCLAIMLGVAACSASDIPFVGEGKDRGISVAEVPGREEVVRGDAEPPIVTLKLKSGLRERRLSLSEDLPGHILIPQTNLNGVPVTTALQAVLSGTDISLAWDAGVLGSRLVTVMNLRGPLPKVVQKICSAAKVFCSYRHGSIELSEKETFIVSIPPVVRAIAAASATSSGSSGTSTPTPSTNSTSNSIVEAINKLLDGEKATVDDQGGNIMYTATVDAEERVSRYLSELRTERPLIVLQMYIWEVTLNRENAQGINWSQFRASGGKSMNFSLSNSLSSLTSTPGSVSLGAVTSGIISANAIASFLATKGRVQTISNPQLTFVSGSTAMLRVGGTQRYISQVGTNVTSNVSGTASTTTGNTSTNTVSTDSIDTGLSISVAGSYENGVVFANLDLAIKSLIDIGATTSGGGTIDLPITADEKITTVLRVRPGDSLVLAGFVTSTNNASTQGFPTGSTSALPIYGDEKHSNRELVMIVKPSIVLFSDKEGEPEKKETATGFPEPIVVDKSGARLLPQIKSPGVVPLHAVDAASVDASRVALEAAAQPTYLAPAPQRRSGAMFNDIPTVVISPPLSQVSQPKAALVPFNSEQPTVVDPSTETYLIPPDEDKGTMSGFSHAFDKLLPTSGNGSVGARMR